MMNKTYYVYILCNRKNGSLYIGITSDLGRRLFEHQNELTEGFCKRYGIKTPVYIEAHNEAPVAIAREKAMKKWSRQWKINLIERANPDWKDLSSHYVSM
jgi:putative endonuclease